MSELSDEEKKAIAYLKSYCTNDVLYDNTHYEQIKILLNLIEKQSKEIEELKEVKWYYEISRVPKSKIKAKIEFIKSLKEKIYYEENVISVLQSLLEEE